MANKVRGSLSVERLLYLGELTTLVRDTISPNSAGPIIWNTTNTRPEIYDGTTWIPLGIVPPVDSVNGKTGEVVLSAPDLAITASGNQTEVDIESAINSLQTKIDNINSSAANGFNALGADPTNADGDDGEYAINVITGDIFGPKDESNIAGDQWGVSTENAYSNLGLSNANPLVSGTSTAGTGVLASREDHVHPSPPVEELAGSFGAAATAATTGQTITKNSAGDWEAVDVALPPYQSSFVAGDWTAGTPNTLTFPLATHGLSFSTGDVYDVVVTDTAGNILTICRQTNTSGDVIITTDGSVFSGTINIQQ